MAQGIYGLTSVRPVPKVSGSMRDATADDRDLLVDWMRAFNQEALHDETPFDAERMVDLRLPATTAGLVLWDDGQRASVAGYGGRTPNGIRIGPVYTPSELRRRGYATALVAALSRRMLDEGHRFCFLYTDLSNPTSNRIYVDIGYEQVCESRDYRFERS
jgi:predicted GNAT family acetyltransferase